MTITAPTPACGVTTAMAVIENIQPLIDHIEATSPQSWQLDVVRSQDGEKNCFFGHLYQWAQDTAAQHGFGHVTEAWANHIWGAFEERWATTYMVFPVNDGSDPRYPQPTARERVLALLIALRDGREMTTHESMEAQFAAYEALEN